MNRAAENSDRDDLVDTVRSAVEADLDLVDLEEIDTDELAETVVHAIERTAR